MSKNNSPVVQKPLQIGNITLDLNIEKSDFVPHSEPFIDNKALLETIAYGIKENLPVLLIGDTGTGKTSAVRYLARETNNSFRRLNLNGQTTADEFVGKILVNEKGTYWTDGILTEAMRKGHWLLLDELNAALPEILFVLQSLLDDDRYIVLSDKPEQTDGKGGIISLANEIVRPHPNFRIFASMNPSDSYVGTKELNKALMSRFPLVVEVDYPEEDKEVEIVKARFPNVDEYEARKVIEFGNELRVSYRAQELDFIFSTRELLNWFKINEFYKNWHKSAEVCLLGKCNDEDKDKIKGLIKIHFVAEVQNVEELEVGDEFSIFKDTTLYNTHIIVAKKSTMKIVDIKKRGVGAETIIQIQITSVPKEALSDSNFASKDSKWAMRSIDLKDNFSLKKKAKK